MPPYILIALSAGLMFFWNLIIKLNLLQISGTIVAPDGPAQWKADLATWLVFKGVNGLTIDGLGTVDGRGKGWWDRSCRYHPTLKGCFKLAPTVREHVGGEFLTTIL